MRGNDESLVTTVFLLIDTESGEDVMIVKLKERRKGGK